MRVVLDTNVVVAGLLSPHGAPGKIVSMAGGGLIRLCFDSRILAEYRDVLKRPKFGFDGEWIDTLLEQIESCGQLVASAPLHRTLPDSGDEPFLEAAVAGNADWLITDNLKHYPSHLREGVHVIGPAAFLEMYRKARK